ncbi:HXXEE domain-containing protein [Mixta mediterraneensis]|uniref:HXXEE domain-containing protein n=1 Tax=Mixta mediterraneensis TaxID=2758443 RepID=UPI0019329CE5|nr:HXXEE domain-containing protein [Mixta mediterraneensis]
MIQIINHGILTNVRMKTFYNPGLVTVLLLQWPLGICYIHFVSAHHLATNSDYIFGLIGAFASIVVLWLGPIRLLRDRSSKYPFPEADMFKFIGRRLREMLAAPPRSE